MNSNKDQVPPGWLALKQAVTPEERLTAVQRLLEERHGWWKDLTLYEYVLGVSRYNAMHYKNLGDLIDIESIATDVIILLLEKCQKITNPGAWIRGMTRYRIIDSLRTERPDLRVSESALKYLAAENLKRRSSQWSIWVRRVWPAIVKSVKNLPEKQRIAIQLVYFEGLSREEAARQLGIQRVALRQNLHRAIKTLRLAKPSKRRRTARSSRPR